MSGEEVKARSPERKVAEEEDKRKQEKDNLEECARKGLFLRGVVERCGGEGWLRWAFCFHNTGEANNLSGKEFYRKL